MTDMSTYEESPDVTELHRAILDSINKGNEYIADVLDSCGPRLDEQKRGMDCSAYLNEVDRLIQRGYIEREADLFDGHLKLHLTKKGKEAAQTLPDAEQKLIDEYGISFDDLRLLQNVIELEAEEGELPSISDLQDSDGQGASSYQYTLRFNYLVDAGLATEKGIFRYRIVPTDAGRRLVEEYETHL